MLYIKGNNIGEKEKNQQEKREDSYLKSCGGE